MVKLIITSLENQVDQKILDVKKEIRAQGESKLGEIKNKLPTKEEILNTLKSEATSYACSPPAQNQMEKVYMKLKKKLERSIIISERNSTKLNNTQSKLNKIKDEIIPKIKGILDLLNKLIQPLSAAIKSLPLTLGLMQGFTANGGVIKTLGDLIDFAKSKIKIFANAIKVFVGMMADAMKKVAKLSYIMLPIITAISKLIDFIKILLTSVELLYLNFLGKCSGEGSEGSEKYSDTEGNINEDFFTNSLEDALDIGDVAFWHLIDSLGLSGSKEVEQRIFNANFQMIGYKRYRVPPINPDGSDRPE